MMHILAGVALILLALLCWGGQSVSWLAPDTAARWSLTEAEHEVEPVYWADIRGEALWDAMTLWTLLVAGLLLAADVSAWAYFGLVGGGMYVYFAGRGITTRMAMQHRGFRIGTAADVRAAFVMLSVWGVAGLLTIVGAVAAIGA